MGIVEHAFHTYDAITAKDALNHKVPPYEPRAEPCEEASFGSMLSELPNIYKGRTWRT